MSDWKEIPAKRTLGSLVLLDPESLSLGTDPRFSFRYIDISAAANGRLALPNDTIEYRDAPGRARRVVRNGDVLMATVRPNLKAFAYCNLPEGNFVASTGFAVLRATNGVDPHFILCSIISDDVSRQIERYVVGSNYPAINSSDVRRLQIPGFGPQEQRRIGTIVASIDEAIAQTEALIAKMQQIKAGLMHDLFTRGVLPNGQLRPPRDEAPQLYKESPLGLIPKEWEVRHLSEHIRIIDCKHYIPNYQTEGYAVIRPRNVKSNGLDLSSVDYASRMDFLILTDLHKPKRGDIVFSRNASFGVSCYIDTDMDFAIGQDVVVMTELVSNTQFVFFALCSETIVAQIQRLSGGSTFGRINLADIRRLNVQMPAKNEQEGIAACLFALDAQISTLIEDREELGMAKQGLMHDLLSGRVRVSVAKAQKVASNV